MAEFNSTNTSSESVISPFHSTPLPPLPLGHRTKLDRDLYYQQAGHFYAESKKTWHLYKGVELGNEALLNLCKKVQITTAFLREQVQHYKAAAEELNEYKTQLEEDRLRELLMLQWRLNGNEAEFKNGKKLLDELIGLKGPTFEPTTNNHLSPHPKNHGTMNVNRGKESLSFIGDEDNHVGPHPKNHGTINVNRGKEPFIGDEEY